jgi:broad specificity phosphatase PhoE
MAPGVRPGAAGPVRVARLRLLLVRHGQSTWNATRRWQGHADPPLSRLGREQARAAAQALAGEIIDVLYASDLRRALETARIVGEPHGLLPRSDPRLRELDLGAWGGLTRAEITARWPELLARFDRGEPDARPLGGETRAELTRRVVSALDELAARHAGARVAIVAHGGVLAALTGKYGHDNAAVVPWSWPR